MPETKTPSHPRRLTEDELTEVVGGGHQSDNVQYSQVTDSVLDEITNLLTRASELAEQAPPPPAPPHPEVPDWVHSLTADLDAIRSLEAGGATVTLSDGTSTLPLDKMNVNIDQYDLLPDIPGIVFRAADKTDH